ncbi:MAG: 4Fe-4S binding protein [Candidatus Methylarchaceae archaeon HK01B]|nr:4Fe-4S binding protein [Candidatus Methylarchaceae archaeon HK01B]
MKLRLIYSPENVQRPILSEIIQRTNVPINILKAEVKPNSGEMLIDVLAVREKLKEVLSLFQKAGVEVKEITRTLEIDHSRCISCGACVSPCPVQAITQDENWDIIFDEEKCIGCRICVHACPMRVIQMF